ncbi:glycosyl transferase [Spirosoma aureum]|uniref:Glycosyl transferase n=2 Tax=Spirosoma aureum TaxID=2692134 RepID=A0A6G9ANB6_9BACT|nr:glycosyl transferase [Spirosoma aureum]
MIPKVIHYCWFGRGKMPAMADRCICSWKQFLPNYELRLWNEDSFDINSVPYVKEAYQARKFAFVTDYVRLYALHQFGGIYLDTDVEVLKSLDDLLHLPAFSGFESDHEIPTGIMASEQHNEWASEQLRYYAGRHFLRPDGSYDMTTNVEIISGSMAANGFMLKNSYQIYKGCMHIFPKDYFCPKSRSGIITISPNTYCIHHFEGSWQPVGSKLKKYIFQKIIGPTITDKLVNLKRSLLSRK